MNMPIIYIEEIETTLLTLFGRILGLIGVKHPFYDFSLWIHKLSNSQLPIITIFEFDRSRRDPKEKIAGTGPDTL